MCYAKTSNTERPAWIDSSVFDVTVYLKSVSEVVLPPGTVVPFVLSLK